MSTPKCIICDLDGTLAIFQNRRNAYDCSRCDEIDEVNPAIFHILQLIDGNNNTIKIFEAGTGENNETKIILMSGREDKFRPQTENWLKRHNIPYHDLFMRKSGDRRSDSIIKMELYNEHINGKMQTMFVYDDRLRVIREVWNKLGLFVFICNQELKEF